MKRSTKYALILLVVEYEITVCLQGEVRAENA